MPNVPVYSAPQVAPTNLPDSRQQVPYRLMQSAENAPKEQQQLGQSMTTAGNEGLRYAAQDQIQQNEAVGKSFDANLMGGIQGILYGTADDPSSGYLNQKGGAASDPKVFQATVQKIQDLATSQGQDMTQAQQELVRNTAQIRIQSATREAIQHRDQQAYIYQQSAGQTRAKVASDGAAPAYNPITDTPTLNFDHDHPDQNSSYQQYLQTVVSETKTLAANQGIVADDLVGAQVKDALAGTYVKTIGYLLAGKKGAAADPGGLASAKQFFDKVQGQLTPEQVDRIKPVLDASSKQDNIVTVQRALENTPGSIADRRKLLGDVFDSKGSIGGVQVNGQIYENAMSALDRLEQKQRSDDDRYTASAVGQAQDFLIRNPGKSVTDLPRSLYVALEAKGHLASIDAFANREATAKTNPTAWFNVQTHFGDGSDRDIGKMSDTDWMQMRSVLSDHDWKSWSSQRDDLKNGIVAPKNDPGNLSTQGFNSALNNRIVSLGINPTQAKTPDEKERVGAIQQYASQWVIADQQAAGKRFNQQETQQSLDKLFATSVDFRNTFLGFSTGSSSQRMMTMTPKDLPGGAYDGIKQDLIRGGNTKPTDRDIMLQYWSLHGRH